MRGKPQAELVLTDAEHEQLTALTLQHQINCKGIAAADPYCSGLCSRHRQQGSREPSACHAADHFKVVSVIARAMVCHR